MPIYGNVCQRDRWGGRVQERLSKGRSPTPAACFLFIGLSNCSRKNLKNLPSSPADFGQPYFLEFATGFFPIRLLYALVTCLY
ncbi:unnamed protein product [Acanthoscelides obtectus]|uniref:Uncharacterized protein n=1 Tax=Acanthoscelides obtectus TaxID=200917 RepID=A0A9P0JXA8_ACAOB|nr:unnamed protein product [Acanthoscelides obtectus]CAK1638088.1 hypothetical protein AOBTE_LOCUS10382 [Acanthoscelides obtectus]